MADKIWTYVPIEVENALIRYIKGDSVWVQSKHKPNKWVRFKRSWNSVPLFDDVRDKCGVWRDSELKTAFHVKQEITLSTKSV